jgi:hypothetical protein
MRPARRRSTATLNCRRNTIEQVIKQQHENHACHRKWFDGSRKKIPSLSLTQNCKVPKRKRTLHLISD